MPTPIPHPDPATAALIERLRHLEQRTSRLEAYLQLDEAGAAPLVRPRLGEDFESTMGGDWFARAGIVAVAVGLVFALSRPYAGAPAAAPALAGYAVAAGLAALGRLWRRGSRPLAGCFLGSALAVAYVATLRLMYFGDRPAVDPNSAAAAAVLSAAAGVNLAIAMRRKSPAVFALALGSGYATVLAHPAPGFALGAFAALAAIAYAATRSFKRLAPTLAALPLAYGGYILWAANDPLLGHPLQRVIGGAWVAAALLIDAAAFAGALRPRSPDEREDALRNVATLFNAAVAFSLFALQGLVSFGSWFAPAQIAAGAAFLSLAVWYAGRPNSVGAFFYAITGCTALSFALLRLVPAPDVFGWLSVESVLVAAIAIALRSRFIAVANAFIYLGILGAYIGLVRSERGMALGLGAVALVTARLLGWQARRLGLGGDGLRNAYLLAAVLVVPYGLYHLVPRPAAAPIWVALALVYYGAGGALGSRQCRWLGHGTLLVTAAYLVLVGAARLDPLYRIVSFLALGGALIAVSLAFSRRRGRRSAPGD